MKSFSRLRACRGLTVHCLTGRGGVLAMPADGKPSNKSNADP